MEFRFVQISEEIFEPKYKEENNSHKHVTKIYVNTK